MRLKSFIAEYNTIQRAIYVTASIGCFMIADVSVIGADTCNVDFSAVNELPSGDRFNIYDFNLNRERMKARSSSPIRKVTI